MSRALAIAPLVVWTLLIWVGRIRNIWTDDELSTTGQFGRTAVSVFFIALAIGAVVVLWRSRGRALGHGERVFIGVFSLWTIGYWIVRGIGILGADHDGSFKAVHTVLALVSMGLAALALRVVAWRGSSAAPVAG